MWVPLRKTLALPGVPSWLLAWWVTGKNT